MCTKGLTQTVLNCVAIVTSTQRMGSSLSRDLSYALKKLSYSIQQVPDRPEELKISGGKLPNEWATLLIVKPTVLLVRSVCHFKVSTDSLVAVNYYLTKINFAMVTGVFELDFRDGEVQLRFSIPTVFTSSRGLSKPINLFEAMFHRHVTTLDRYSASVVLTIQKPSLVPQVPSSSEEVHYSVTCDGCKKRPLKGTRYKCKTCADYDLCQTCKDAKIHSHHNFSVISSRGGAAASEPPKSPGESPKSPGGRSTEQDLLAGLLKLLLSGQSVQNKTSTEDNEEKQNGSFKSPSTRIVPFQQVKFVLKSDGRKTKLGKGGFATVYLAKFHGMEVATKVINESLAPDIKQLFAREVGVMSALHHPHIVLMLGLVEEPQCIIMPLMKKGSLQDVINKGNVSMAMKLKYLLGAAKGMAFIHGNKVIHGDLKPLNILIDENDVAYVADFGLSKLKASSSAMKAGTVAVGYSLYYAAPEIFTTGKMNNASDIYAFAIMIWNTVTQRTPYFDCFSNELELRHKVGEGMRPDKSLWPSSTPQQLKVMTEACWHSDPTKRPDFIAIIELLQQLVNDTQI